MYISPYTSIFQTNLTHWVLQNTKCSMAVLFIDKNVIALFYYRQNDSTNDEKKKH